jgi:hypothetical protein
VIDFKKFGADGAWWRDSRGVNDFLEVNTLLLVGTPCRNLLDLASEYGIATGTYPTETDLGFKAFVQRAIQAEIHQAIGRLRAHRRPTESLTVVLISNLEMADLNTQQVAAQALTPDAASKTERVQMAIASAIQTLQASGQKVTQQLVAAITAVPRGTIARYWSLFISLIKKSNSKMNNHSTEPQQIGFNQGVATVLEEVARSPLEQLLPGVEEVFFQWLQPQQWGQVWTLVSGQAQLKILAGLSLTLPKRTIVEVM